MEGDASESGDDVMVEGYSEEEEEEGEGRDQQQEVEGNPNIEKLKVIWEAWLPSLVACCVMSQSPVTSSISLSGVYLVSGGVCEVYICHRHKRRG